MNKLEKFLSRFNFKKAAVWYIIIAVIVGIACTVTLAVMYRERISFAWEYSRLKESTDKNASYTLADKAAAASNDITDIIFVDEKGKIIYSAKNSQFADKPFLPQKFGNDKKYLTVGQYPDIVFKYVKSDEFLLTSVLNEDIGRALEDFEDDSVFENRLSSKTVYMLNCIHNKNTEKIYIISSPTSVPGGTIAIKLTAASAMLFFCVYWVLIALWMYADAAKSKLSPIYWGLIGLFTNIIGLIVYKIYKFSSSVCPCCRAVQNSQHLFCSHCGAQLGARCESCGAKINAKDHFCHRCGNKIIQ